MTNKNCECLCHTIVPLKKGESYPVQYDRPVNCEHCTRSNNMTPPEVDMALAQFIDQEIELLEKEIDNNDDGMWTGREFADKWLAHLTSLKEQIK